MAHLLFTVEGQNLVRKDTFFVAAGSVNYLTAGFEFITDDWEGVSPIAVFSGNGVVKQAVLDDSNECFVPNEVLAQPGKVTVSVYGQTDVLVTTNKVDIYVYESGYEIAEEDLDPITPTMVDQLTDYFNEARQEVQENREYVEARSHQFEHIDGGSFLSEDWTGEPLAGDTQTSTIQIRGGNDADLQEDKILPREVVVSNGGVVKIKLPSGTVKTFTLSDTTQALSEALDLLREDHEASAGALNTLISNFNTLRLAFGNAVVDARVGEDGCLYMMNESGEDIVGPLGPFAGGGGGGGGSAVYSQFRMVNAMPDGKRIFNITEEELETAYIAWDWSSLDNDTGEPTGDGTCKVYNAKGFLIYQASVPQGVNRLSVKDYVDPMDNDANTFRVTVSDIDGNQRTLSYTFTIVATSVSSTFNDKEIQYGPFNFDFVAIGQFDKYGYLYVDDELTVTTNRITTSGTTSRIVVPKLSYGVHRLKFYIEADYNGSRVKSNELYYEVICSDAEGEETLIASGFNLTEAVQYTPFIIEYRVYNPYSETSPVTITTEITDEEGHTTTTAVDLNVDRASQNHYGRLDTIGTTKITITSGRVSKEFTIVVNESNIKVKAATEGMALYLSSNSRSNAEVNPAVWTYEDIDTTFSNFDWASSGWVADANGEVALHVVNDARAVVNYRPFVNDWTSTGKTLEVEFATSGVTDYAARIFQSYINGVGFYITPTRLVLDYVGGTIEVPFKEAEHITVALSVEKYVVSASCYRLIRLYVNGDCSAVIQYTDPSSGATSMSQGRDAVPITIGGVGAAIDVYKIRIYDLELTKRQVVDNWIADTRTIESMLARYTRNDVYDEFGKLILSKLPETTPYLIISTTSELPKLKKDPYVEISGYFIWPAHPEKSFAFYDAQLTVQGTSSEAYDVKNYKIKFANGFIMFATGETQSKFKMRENSVGINKPCVKADYASCESANNIILVRLHNDITPYRTPHQQVQDFLAESDPNYVALDIRQGVDGFACIIVRAEDNDLRSKVRAGTYDTTAVSNLPVSFMGKYNFNNDKGNEDVFGFAEGDQSWEQLVNSGGIVLMQDGVMDDWEAEIEAGKDSNNQPIYKKAWKTQIEARYPEDNEDYTDFKALVDWVKSTDVVTPQLSAEEKAELGCTASTLTQEQITARLQKFHDEAPDWFEMDALHSTFVFTDTFLMIDNWVKNAFWTKMTDTVDGVEVVSKWFDLPYDYDSALGIDNNGRLKFDYFLEGTDHIVTVFDEDLDPNEHYDILAHGLKEGKPTTTLVEWASRPIAEAFDRTNIYNGQLNTIWVNYQNPTYGFMDDAANLYSRWRSSGAITFEKLVRIFLEHQQAWPEVVRNEDGDYKYLEPLFKKGDPQHLPKYLGSKEAQRAYWLYYRLKYQDSKYNYSPQWLETRTYAPREGLTLIPIITMYVAATWANIYPVAHVRTHSGEAVTINSLLPNAAPGSDNVLYIYSPEMLLDLGDLAPNQLEYLNVSAAKNLVRVKVGDADPNYSNSHFVSLSFATYGSGVTYDNLLVVDARNLINLGSGMNNTPTTQDMRMLNALQEVYFDGTSMKSLLLPTTGTLRVVHFSEQNETVIIRNQPNIEDLSVPDWSQQKTVILENIGNIVDLKNLHTELASGTKLRLSGFTWDAEDMNEIDAWLAAIDAKEFDWLDVNGASTRKQDEEYAQQEKTLTCTINVPEATGDYIESLSRTWIGVTINPEHIEVHFSFYNEVTELYTTTIRDYGDAAFPDILPEPTKAADQQYTYTFEGWSTDPNADEPEEGVLEHIGSNTIVYAVFSKTVNTYTVTYINSAGTTLYTDYNVPYGGTSTYNSPVVPTDPSGEGKPFFKWNPNTEGGFTGAVGTPTGVENVVGNTACSPVFEVNYTVNFWLDLEETTLLSTTKVLQGRSVTYTGTPNPPVNPAGTAFLYWDKATEMQAVWENLDVHAVFERTYTVNFVVMTDQGEQHLKTVNNIPEGGSANYGSTPPIDPSGNGAAFLRWNPAPVDIHEDMTCVAVFETLYNVYFYQGDELLATVNNVHYGEDAAYPLSQTPTMPNKRFTGWSPAPINISADTYCFAQFEDTYTVSWYIYDTLAYELTGIQNGHRVSYAGPDPNGLGHDGADFLGWDVPSENLLVDRNMIIHALYETVYSVTFRDYDGTLLAKVNGVKSGATATYPNANPTRSGYQFLNWNPAPVGITADTTVTATYGKLFSVEFWANGNRLHKEDDVLQGSSVEYTGAVPADTSTGATWNGGWDPQPINVQEDLVCYATYGEAYTATFKANGETIQVLKGIAPNTLVEFDGSNLTGAHGARFLRWNPEPRVVNSNIVCTAVFATMYQVNFLDVDNTTVIQTQWVEENTVCNFDTSQHALPIKENYDFIGWNPDPTDEGGVTGTMTCYPQFRIKESYLWNTFGAALEDGTYASKYRIKDTLPVTVAGVGTFDAIIIGIDKDLDPYGNAIPVTFSFKQNYAATPMNATSATVTEKMWDGTSLRNTVLPGILNNFPDYVSKYITPAKKVTLAYNGADKDVTTYDTLWIPSVYELYGTNAGVEDENGRIHNREKGTCEYTSYYVAANDMIRYNLTTGRAEQYWTRTANANEAQSGNEAYNNQYQVVGNVGGVVGTLVGTESSGINICFCTCKQSDATANREIISDPAWVDFKLLEYSLNNGTYATDYKVGDTFRLRLNGYLTNGIIIGINKDVDSNDDTVPLTIMPNDICHDLQYPIGYGTGNGAPYSASSVRSTTNNYDSYLKDYVKNRIVSVKKYTNIDRSNLDKMEIEKYWVPSIREIIGANVSGDFGYNTTETMGPTYIDYFNSNDRRIRRRYPNGNAAQYAIRSTDNIWPGVYNRASASFIKTNGIPSQSKNSEGIRYTLACFCLK